MVMDRVMLETGRDQWLRLAVFPYLHGSSIAQLSLGSHNLELHADTGNVYYHRAVLGKIHELPVGYMRNHVASYYQPPIIKLRKAGIILVTHCRILTPSTIIYRCMQREDLLEQAAELIEAKQLIKSD